MSHSYPFDPNDHLFEDEVIGDVVITAPDASKLKEALIEELKRNNPKTKRKYTKRKQAKVNNQSQFENVTMKAIAQAMHILRATKCAYKIVTVDGAVFSDGDVHAFRGQTKPIGHPRGFIAAHFKPYLEPMKIGDTAAVPWHPQIREDDLQSAMSAWMTGKWGKGSYTTQKNNTKKVIEVLRYK